MLTSVKLGGVELHGLTLGGSRAEVARMEGWLATRFERTRTGLTARDGASSSRGTRPQREVTLELSWWFGTAADADLWRRRIPGWWGRDEVGFIVADQAGATALSVTVDEFSLTPKSPLYLAGTATLVADSPLIQAVTPVTTPVPAGSTVSVESPGTEAADLRVTVTSAGTVKLTAGGLTLTTTALPVGAVIDTGARTVTSSAGVDLWGTVATFAQWPALPRGGGPIEQAGTAGLSIQHFDTYA